MAGWTLPGPCQLIYAHRKETELGVWGRLYRQQRPDERFRWLSLISGDPKWAI